jgi:hypothetical protein
MQRKRELFGEILSIAAQGRRLEALCHGRIARDRDFPC